MIEPFVQSCILPCFPFSAIPNMHETMYLMQSYFWLARQKTSGNRPREENWRALERLAGDLPVVVKQLTGPAQRPVVTSHSQSHRKCSASEKQKGAP